MPIYEYECTSCHHNFDVMQKINDEPVSQCLKCGKNTAIKLISAAGFQLKGTGWYATDFKNKKTSPASTDDSAKSVSTNAESKKSTKDEA